MYIYIMYMYIYTSVSPKGWYHGAPLPFNFKAEKHCFITPIDQMSCITDALPHP